MPNQLVIPFKQSQSVDIAAPIRHYIKTYHHDTHPDAFRWDISRWESMRKDAISETIHISKPPVLLLYQAQLVFILTKFPSDIDLSFTYQPLFPKTYARPLTLKNLYYERVGVLCNIASLYCQLANQEDRSTAHGTKQAVNYYQLSAGTLSFLIDSVLPSMQSSAATPLPQDLSPSFFRSLHLLMLAQAQECGWQKARMDNMKNNIIARLSMKTSMLYASVVGTIDNAPSPIISMFPPEWIAHIKTKQQHFLAVAQYRRSMDERYGEAIARLTAALECAKKAEEFSKQSRYVNKAVQDDARGLTVNIKRDLDSANRDNDLIYHKDIPSLASLAAITPAELAVASVPRELVDPAWCLNSASEQPLFGDLLAHGARIAIELYQDRKSNWIKEEIIDRRKTLDKEATSVLQKLHLPAALEALDKIVGLPPSLLGKAEEIRRDGGVQRVMTLIADVQTLAEQDRTLLEETLDILDQEAEDDESFRDLFMKTGGPLERPPSHEANKDLTERILRYRDAVTRALESDRVVRSHWEQWKATIEVLNNDQTELEKVVPTPTRSNSQQGSLSHAHARTLRELLELLSDVRNQRDQTVTKATRLASSDGIHKRIACEATGIERWTEVKPEVFEDAISEELSKYEEFKEELDISESEQQDLLEKIRAANVSFLQSRREDPSIKERQQVLQSLDDAYHHYQEIVGHLCEGLEFYNKLAAVLIDIREEAKQWVDGRNQEVKWITEAFDKMEIGPDSGQSSYLNPNSLGSADQNSNTDSRLHTSTNQVNTVISPSNTPAVNPSSSSWKPSSKIVQGAMTVATSAQRDRVASQSPVREAGSSQPSKGPVTSPWHPQVFAYDLNAANWENEEPFPPTPPKLKAKAKILDRNLANAEWEDEEFAHPTPSKSEAKARVLDRNLANAEWEEDPIPTPSKGKAKHAHSTQSESPRSQTRGGRHVKIPG